MRAFHCDNCGSLVFFENFQCVRCGEALGFLPDVIDLSTLSQGEDNTWMALSPEAQGRSYRFCQNATQHQVCNWLIPTSDPHAFCQACRLNDVIPDLDVLQNHTLWHKLEIAKRRVIYTLLRLHLPLDGTPEQGRAPLRFRFLRDVPGKPSILTGHNQGIITLNLEEADDAERERRRVALREPFRTLLGHLRHEIAHYYWDHLVAQTPRLDRFRGLFGDERQDYNQALEHYYQQGPPADWQVRNVSAYASAHPWEDWAETWAHYLHIVDTIETAGSFGLSLRPKHPDSESMSADPNRVSTDDASFDRLLDHWFPLTYALNELNRGMGLPDLYPFVISRPSIAKLSFIHEVIHQP